MSEQPVQNEQPESELIRVRREKLDRIVALGYRAFPTRAETDTTIEAVVAKHGAKSAQELEAERPHVKIAGRIMLIREFGKTAFLVLSEKAARIQIYCRKDTLPEREWELYKNLDAGDWISAEGTVFRTKTNELSVKAEHIDFLVKALRPLPSKWHGLTDVEQRYRQRYVDLIVNDDVKQTFETRAKIVRYIRNFFDGHPIAGVEVLVQLPFLLGERVLAAVGLDARGALGEDEKRRLAELADGHDATRHFDARLFRFQVLRRFVRKLLHDVGDGGIDVGLGREGVVSEVDDAVELLAADANQLALFLFDRFDRRLAHSLCSASAASSIVSIDVENDIRRCPSPSAPKTTPGTEAIDVRSRTASIAFHESLPRRSRTSGKR